jgi:hypothetical protein
MKNTSNPVAETAGVLQASRLRKLLAFTLLAFNLLLAISLAWLVYGAKS